MILFLYICAVGESHGDEMAICIWLAIGTTCVALLLLPVILHFSMQHLTFVVLFVISLVIDML